ncbi:MAG: CBS domain-containing protein [Chloroflexi bacterium]|nr:CBS domain-containing protein [Chloroflexota bacterium]
MRRLSRYISRIVDRYQPSETTLLLIVAILIGLITGLAAVLFIKLIGWITVFSFGSIPEAVPALGRWWLLIIPVLGSLISGPIIAYFAQEAKGHGVPEVMQALVLRGGRIRPRVAVAKVIASSVCIGTGGSAGREGPIVQVGSTFGSMMGQLMRMSDERISNLVACGAAAGIAATFNAPIAGVAFAIEVLVGDLGISLLSNVVISAVTASVVSRIFLGSEPAFQVPGYALNNPIELVFYAVLGFLTAYIGIAFIRTLYATEDLFDNWKGAPLWLKPAVGAVFLGLLGVAVPPFFKLVGVDPELAKIGWPLINNLPHIFGAGFETIEAALVGPLPWILLVSLIVLKMLATALTLGSGNSGGVFAPSLFMGAMLGGLFGIIVNHLFPTLAINPGAYALAGMAGVFVGAARAPLTAMLIAFEMSNDYQVILPLMIVSIISVVVAHHHFPESIYTLKLARRGLRLRFGRDVDVLDHVLVEEIMDTDPPVVSADLSLRALQEYFDETHHHGAMVLDEQERLVGIITLQDLVRAKTTRPSWEDIPVSACMTKTFLTARPGETIGAALQRMAARDIGRLPVVDPDDPSKLLGVIRRQAVIRAYRIGIIHRQEIYDRAIQQRTSASSGVEFLELQVAPNSAVAGKRVSELNLPEDVLLTTRRHGSRRHLLHGNDVLEAGDIVMALAEPDKAEMLRKMFSAPAET